MYSQKGQNSKYPTSVYTWKIGEVVPEWLSDRARVKFVDGEGKVTLDTRNETTGGLEILAAEGNTTLVRLIRSNDVLCLGVENKELLVLSEVQFILLYGG